MNSLLSIFSGLLQTQEKFLFKDEKINTVIVIILVIWAGIVGYLLWTGRKVAALEKEVAAFREETEREVHSQEKTIEVKRKQP